MTDKKPGSHDNCHENCNNIIGNILTKNVGCVLHVEFHTKTLYTLAGSGSFCLLVKGNYTYTHTQVCVYTGCTDLEGLYNIVT